ncbi:unnamed protein product [Alternaria alternata]
MSSYIAKRFATVKARQRPLREKAHLIEEVNKNLRSWYKTLSPDVRIAFPVDTKKIPRGLCAEHLMLFFYYPLLGMINMFASILKSPAGVATEKDMGVIDMAADYSAYLDYSTDAVLSFDLVKNLAQ